MQLYNTPDRKLQQVQPQNPPKVTVYTCGPTVYDYPHIGNWFTFIRYDLLIRTLKASGLETKWALNITDVGHLVSDADEGEDKLQKGAKREGKSAWDIAKTYTDYFVQGLTRLNILNPDYLPKATDHIAEQLEFVKGLEQKGFTYKISDGVYFDTSKFPKYGEFAHLDLAHQETGVRVQANPEKKNPSDFALWKFSHADSKRDMEWDSPWGKGFPGWHLECSAMILKYFGDTVDIHAGGVDHIPTHHQNEIAQSEALNDKPLAKYWMHANHILVDDKKIAKSEGNGITLEDIEAKGFKMQDLRLLVLQSHYRTQSVFSWDQLEAARNKLRDYRAMAVLRYQAVETSGEQPDFAETKHKILGSMQDDLNSPQALAALNSLETTLQTSLLGQTDLEEFNELLKTIDSLSGLKLSNEQDITDDQKALIQEREEARKNQDWQKSDQLRQQLSGQGIEINDTNRGPIWYRS